MGEGVGRSPCRCLGLADHSQYPCKANIMIYCQADMLYVAHNQRIRPLRYPEDLTFRFLLQDGPHEGCIPSLWGGLAEMPHRINYKVKIGAPNIQL